MKSTSIKKSFCIMVFTAFCFALSANDGAYRVSGNQLIPITETSIRVQKEILTINRNYRNAQQVDVIVYYEFYNPGAEKKTTVGFEADPPYGDVAETPNLSRHPFIHNFTVDMNAKILPYKMSLVGDSIYAPTGKVKALTAEQIQSLYNCEYFRYVYYFDAVFKPGLNIIKHTYTCDLSGSVMGKYLFNYVLTAAKRWGNRQIDDFTLNINMGENQYIGIQKNFFTQANQWTILGIGRANDNENYFGTDENKFSGFYMRNGYLSFHKQNFKPEGELFIISPQSIFYNKEFDSAAELLLPSGNDWHFEDITPIDELSKKILKNLPFAQRGYIFTTPELQKYYEHQLWYIPDPAYKAEMSNLPEEEQLWVRHFSE